MTKGTVVTIALLQPNCFDGEHGLYKYDQYTIVYIYSTKKYSYTNLFAFINYLESYLTHIYGIFLKAIQFPVH